MGIYPLVHLKRPSTLIADLRNLPPPALVRGETTHSTKWQPRSLLDCHLVQTLIVGCHLVIPALSHEPLTCLGTVPQNMKEGYKKSSDRECLSEVTTFYQSGNAEVRGSGDIFFYMSLL